MYFFLIDINECSEETDDCAQNCTNTNGSYTCSCNPGFILDTDRRNCNGKAVKIRRIIILLLWYNIIIFTLQISWSAVMALTAVPRFATTQLDPIAAYASKVTS